MNNWGCGSTPASARLSAPNDRLLILLIRQDIRFACAALPRSLLLSVSLTHGCQDCLYRSLPRSLAGKTKLIVPRDVKTTAFGLKIDIACSIGKVLMRFVTPFRVLSAGYHRHAQNKQVQINSISATRQAGTRTCDFSSSSEAGEDNISQRHAQPHEP